MPGSASNAAQVGSKLTSLPSDSCLAGFCEMSCSQSSPLQTGAPSHHQLSQLTLISILPGTVCEKYPEQISCNICTHECRLLAAFIKSVQLRQIAIQNIFSWKTIPGSWSSFHNTSGLWKFLSVPEAYPFAIYFKNDQSMFNSWTVLSLFWTKK